MVSAYKGYNSQTVESLEHMSRNLRNIEEIPRH